jgi:phage gp36-like protein
MAYATSADMIRVYGETEMIRLSVPDAALDGPANLDAINQALTDATDTIDGYLRARYAVPLATPVPPAIARACRVLARYDLSTGEQKTPSEQMTRERQDVIAWLRDISKGAVELDVAAAPAATTEGSGATVTDRPAMFTSGGGLAW